MLLLAVALLLLLQLPLLLPLLLLLVVVLLLVATDFPTCLFRPFINNDPRPTPPDPSPGINIKMVPAQHHRTLRPG